MTLSVLATFVAETPVAVRSGREESGTQTLDYLPGGTLRGAVAEAHRLLRPAADDEFATLFGVGGVGFGNAYPSLFAAEILNDPAQAVRPLAATALTCKRHAGFRADPESDPRRRPHGARDSTAAQVLFALSDRRNVAALASIAACGFQAGGQAPPCAEHLARFSGFVRRQAGAPAVYATARPRRRLHTRIGLSRARGTAQESILYSREVHEPGSRFQSRITGEPDHLQAIREVMAEAAECGLLRVGTNRTRGMGSLVLAETDWQPVDVASDAASEGGSIADRLAAFAAALGGLAKAAGSALPQAAYLPILLESDLILTDRFFRYRGGLDAGWLAEAAGLSGATLVFQAAGLRRVAGWNALAGLPKTDDWAIAKGSVFVFGLAAAIGPAAILALEELERRGIGERREEGFGRPRIADPFQTEVVSI